MKDAPKGMIKLHTSELGAGLDSLRAWNRAADIVALEVLLQIKLLSDEQGCSQLTEVRDTLGIKPDRMTRCIRMLLGRKQSPFASVLGANRQRQPLINMVAYSDSPSINRATLTPSGKRIVDAVLAPVYEQADLALRHERQLEKCQNQLNKYEAMERSLKALGFDTEALADASPANTNQVGKLLQPLLEDMAALSLDDIHQPQLPRVLKFAESIPGMRPNGKSFNGAREHWHFVTRGLADFQSQPRDSSIHNETQSN